MIFSKLSRIICIFCFFLFDAAIRLLYGQSIPVIGVWLTNIASSLKKLMQTTLRYMPGLNLDFPILTGSMC